MKNEPIQPTIKNIQFFWETRNEIFEQDQSCIGKIIVSSDGWFEGLIREFTSDNKIHFIFGVIDEMNLEFFDTSKLDLPYRFVAEFNQKDYEGDFYAITSNDSFGIKLGRCKVIMGIDHSLIEIDPNIIKDTMSQIDLYKKDMKDPEIKLYENFQKIHSFALENDKSQRSQSEIKQLKLTPNDF